MRLAPAQLAASWQRRRRRASPRCPFGRATLLCNTGAAAAGSAAHVVLEWGAPWSRQTHRFYPPAVRARVAELMRVAQAIKRGKAAYKVDGALVGYENPGSVADVFEACVIPHMVNCWIPKK